MLLSVASIFYSWLNGKFCLNWNEYSEIILLPLVFNTEPQYSLILKHKSSGLSIHQQEPVLHRIDGFILNSGRSHLREVKVSPNCYNSLECSEFFLCNIFLITAPPFSSAWVFSKLLNFSEFPFLDIALLRGSNKLTFVKGLSNNAALI